SRNDSLSFWTTAMPTPIPCHPGIYSRGPATDSAKAPDLHFLKSRGQCRFSLETRSVLPQALAEAGDDGVEIGDVGGGVVEADIGGLAAAADQDHLGVKDMPAPRAPPGGPIGRFRAIGDGPALGLVGPD